MHCICARLFRNHTLFIHVVCVELKRILKNKSSQNLQLFIYFCLFCYTGDSTAPEPIPTTTLQLQNILHAYRINDNDLNSKTVMNSLFNREIYGVNHNIVVVLDDFLLTLDVAEYLLQSVSAQDTAMGGEVVSAQDTFENVRLTDEMISDAVRHTITTSSGGSGGMFSWVGRRVSSWDTVTTTTTNTNNDVSLTINNTEPHTTPDKLNNNSALCAEELPSPVTSPPPLIYPVSCEDTAEQHVVHKMTRNSSSDQHLGEY